MTTRPAKTALSLEKFQRAFSLHQQGRLLQAEALYEEVLRAQPGHFDALHLLGVLAGQRQRPSLALRLIDQALGLDPRHALAHYNRGLALKALKRQREALDSFETALRLDSSMAQAHFERAHALHELQRPLEALLGYEQALRLRADYAEAHYNRAVVLRELARWPEALQAYDRAVAARPDYALAHAGQATLRLLLGDYERGWAQFEWRWREQSTARERREFGRPPWLGEQPLQGRRILLHAEQGMGDTLQFCRYAPLVADLGAHVILQVPAPLVEPLRSLRGVAEIIADGGALPPFDCHCPLMSLPLAFRTTLASIPAQLPYLRADSARRAAWRLRMQSAGALKVGLVWAGGFRPRQPELAGVNARRNIPLAALAPLQHPGIHFFSLQKGQPAESELKELRAHGWSGPRIVELGPELRDFADTAAVIENLDLVISVDTSTAHLAGALGKPVWILNRFDTCWRWLLDRTDTPWYPTARLYRQLHPGDWEGVVARLRTDLLQLAVSATPGTARDNRHTDA